MREKKIEQYLSKRVRELGGQCFKWTSPGNRGVPDRICLLPDGKLLLVELKSSTGRLSKLQQYRFSQFERLGHSVMVINSKEQIDALS